MYMCGECEEAHSNTLWNLGGLNEDLFIIYII